MAKQFLVKLQKEGTTQVRNILKAIFKHAFIHLVIPFCFGLKAHMLSLLYFIVNTIFFQLSSLSYGTDCTEIHIL